MSRPACDRCNDIGWVEEPYYGDFEPRVIPQPCPDCNAGVVPMTRGEILGVVMALALFIALLAWGAQ